MRRKILLLSALFCLGVSISAYAQADVTLDAKQQKKAAREAEGVLKFKTALSALEARNFVIENYNPQSTDKSRVCYNYLSVEGDSVFMQKVWAPSRGSTGGGGFSQSTGKILKLEMTPDKKGNIRVYLEADMVVKEGGGKNLPWPLKRHFKLFKNTNAVPWPDGWEGYVVLPSQSKAVQLKGSMPPSIPRGLF